MTTDATDPHVCFGCSTQIADDEPHIHAPMDELSAMHGFGLQPLGMDDLLTFPFCSGCIEASRRGFTVERHRTQP